MRLDANERAQKVLALGVVHAHHLGIHLSHIVDEMPQPEAEMFKRIWWCMYILDRRVALVLGRPFLIQDANIGIGPPRDLSVASPEVRRLIPMTTKPSQSFSFPLSSSLIKHAWIMINADYLVCSKSMRGSTFDFYHLDKEPLEPSPIHYLFVMVGYSKLVGKVWEALLSAEPSTPAAKPYLNEYLDTLVDNWVDATPSFLKCDQEDVHHTSGTGSSSTIFKQRFLIQLVRIF
jgi:hypothetical protein